jgi:DNA-binding response OmpR family regulator
MPQIVLIVDDSPPLHELVKVHLDAEALIIHSAFDGASGLKMAASLNPDLILLDVDMPTMSGFEVCRALKGDAATAAIPVVFLSAGTSSAAKVCGLELQAVDYITKPFDPDELCARVRAALRTKRLLDLLPKTKGAKDASPSGRQLNARLSMAELAVARAGNPWNRKPPGSSSNFKLPEQAIRQQP